MTGLLSFNRLARHHDRVPPLASGRFKTVNQARRLNDLVLPYKKAKYMPLDFDLKEGAPGWRDYFFVQPGKCAGWGVRGLAEWQESGWAVQVPVSRA